MTTHIMEPIAHSNQRDESMDLLKTLAIFFVIIYHFNNFPINILEDKQFSSYAYYFITSILSTCVPLFFFVNGALLLHKKVDVTKHTIKIIKLIALTIVWAAITMIALMFIRHQYFSPMDTVRSILILKPYWINHLWFLPALVIIYFFLPLLATTYQNSKSNFYFFFSVVMLFTFGLAALVACSNVSAFLLGKNFLDGNFYFFRCLNPFKGFFAYSLGYFLLGGILITYKQKFDTLNYRLLAIGTLVLSMSGLFLYGLVLSAELNKVFDIVFDAYDSLFTLANVIALFILAIPYKQAGVSGKAIKIISENTLGIYFIHVILGNMLRETILTGLPLPPLVSSILFSILLLFLSTSCCVILKRIPFVKYLVSL